MASTQGQEFKLRNHPPEDAKRIKTASHIFISKDAMVALGAIDRDGNPKNGTPGQVQSISDQTPAIVQEGLLWAANENIGKGVAQMSPEFRAACGVTLSDKVRITVVSQPVPDADEVVLQDVSGEATDTEQDSTPELDPSETASWEWLLAQELPGVQHVFCGFTIRAGTHSNRKIEQKRDRTFRVLSVQKGSRTLAKFVPGKSTVKLATASSTAGGDGNRPTVLEIANIPGMEPQVQELNEYLRGIGSYSPCGFILHGTRGTGKTMLLRAIAKTGWGTVYAIEPDDKLSKIQEVFETARKTQPSIITLDNIDALISSERSNKTQVIRTIEKELSKLEIPLASPEGSSGQDWPRVLVIATCRDLNEIPYDLRRACKFSDHLELPVPDVKRRKEILLASNFLRLSGDNQDLLQMATLKTHAYNGDDLARLMYAAMRLAKISPKREDSSGTAPKANILTEDILLKALKDIRPSAMREVHLNPPPIPWDQIAGQDEAKRVLKGIVKTLNATKDYLTHYPMAGPKGVLLFGPPGCSKTMIAQAMATESGLNYFAVKGAELINMYVGESERAIRKLFAQARQAAPSMIFFDEFDSIAGRRHGFGGDKGGGGGGGGTSQSGMMNVLTTLLNEMDGFETMQGVFILAATNRPRALDPAVLRSGRCSELIYIGLPNKQAREDILRASLSRLYGGSVDMGEFDVGEIADLADGCSGAEVKNIFDKALSKAANRHWDGDAWSKLTMDDLRAAAKSQWRTVNKEMVAEYQDWERNLTV